MFPYSHGIGRLEFNQSEYLQQLAFICGLKIRVGMLYHLLIPMFPENFVSVIYMYKLSVFYSYVNVCCKLFKILILLNVRIYFCNF